MLIYLFSYSFICFPGRREKEGVKETNEQNKMKAAV